MSKGQVKPVQKSTSTRAVKKLFRMYLDLGGKMKTRSFGGNWYTLIIRDDFSHWTRVFFLKHKSDPAVGFAKFLADYRTKGVPCEVVSHVPTVAASSRGSLRKFAADTASNKSSPPLTRQNTTV
ncbi:unnamed protein product [Ectocarpus sp. CCAP 1310/34]|nr:unnamed protein product [Ectocarpus sp. CCAP 1310/34]